jgi:Zn-dependent metalloprotease
LSRRKQLYKKTSKNEAKIMFNKIKNINATQKRVLAKLHKQKPKLTIRWNEDKGVASLIEDQLISWKEIKEPENIISAVLRKFGPLIGPRDVLENHRVVSIKKTKRGFRVQACQLKQGMVIYGAALVVFGDQEHGIYRIQSSFWRNVKITANKKLDEKTLQEHLLRQLPRQLRSARFQRTWKRKEKPEPYTLEHFPLATKPTLYLYPVKKGFHHAYHLYAYQQTKWVGVDGIARPTFDRSELMVDAATGRILWTEPSKEGMAYTDTVGDGKSTLQDASNNYLVRLLHTVQEDSADYFLINRTNTPQIITHDAGGTDSGIVNKLKNDTDISKDANNHWNQTTTSCNATNRRDSQQPEVDGHFNAEQTWNFYHNLGYDGFDDGGWGAHCPIRVVAHIGMDSNAYFSKYSVFDADLNQDKYYGYICFYDGSCTGTTIDFDFMAGDPIVFAHEYQHAITFFGATKADGTPGHLYGNDWLGAIREGYSDAFGCLQRGLWVNPAFWREGALRSGQPFRRIEYPRSTNTHLGDWFCDHYDDVGLYATMTTSTGFKSSKKYFLSTLLSHVAYLTGQGGIHERTSRAAELIPVVSIGREKTAEIFLTALTQYFSNIPTNKAGETLIEAARYLLDAAEQIGGNQRSCEYVMMRRALYAVGLYPYDNSYNKQTYGGEACMLPWTIAWQYSRPYLGFPALWYQSPDLFINNNGSSQYNAIVGQENKLFARVRNIGDQDLANIRVRFFFRPVGTNLPASSSQWMPCQTQAGTDCILDIPLLPAGSMNFTDPNNPPADQGVDWYLDPSIVTTNVDHFCVRAVIEFTGPTPANHDNDCPNYVQSNIQFETLDAGDGFKIAIVVQNWLDETVPLDLKIEHSLPKGVDLKYLGIKPWKDIVLNYGKEQVLKWYVSTPKRMSETLLPPYDGTIKGKVYGKVSGPFEGQISQIIQKRSVKATNTIKIEATIAGTLGILARLTGRLYGELDLKNRTIHGRIIGNINFRGTRHSISPEMAIKGRIAPTRAIHFTQLVAGKPVGGVTVNVKLRNPEG